MLLEQSVGQLSPDQAIGKGAEMIEQRRILPLEGGLMTTLTIRAGEQAIERRIGELAKPTDRDVGEVARAIASEQVAEQIGGHLSDEQAHALEAITGRERAAILIGPAGTGKGVVIDAAARSEQLTGRNCRRSAPAACSTGCVSSCRTRSSPTCAAHWTRPSSGHGRTCAPAAPTARWPTTTPKAACTWQTPATKPSSAPSPIGRT